MPTDTTCIVELVLENEFKYHGLAVRINSGDDGATSSKNLVNFCLVTPEMTGLICIRLVRHSQQESLLCQMDRTMRLSVEILQLQNIPFEN